MNKNLFAYTALAVSLFPMTALAETVYQPVATSTPGYVVQPATAGVVAPVVVVNQQPPPPPPPEEKKSGWGEFNISGGKAMFQGDSKDFLDDAAAVEVGFYGPMRRAGQFGLEGGYIIGANLKGTLPGRLTPSVGGVPATGPFTSDVKANIVRGTPEFRFGPLIRTGDFKIMPYVVAGGGFYWTHYTDDALDFSSGSGTIPHQNDYNGGWNAGGGLTVGITPGFGIGVDVRYHDIIYTHGPDTTYLLPEGKLAFFF
jgi:opacity protein-like surface antigen